jgi:hypothetical protein
VNESHKFKSISFEGLYSDVQRACDWLSSIGCAVSPTRIGTYQRDIRALTDDYKSDRAMQLTEPKRFEQLLISIYEAIEFVSIFRGLESYQHESLIPKLKEMASGPILSTDEKTNSSSNRARNTSYELLTAARLIVAGYDIDLSTEADIIAHRDGFTIYVECKRPQSADAVNGNLKDALRQLRSRYDMAPDPVKARGMVALSISKAVPVTSQLLRAKNNLTAGVEFQRVVNRFQNEHERRWNNVPEMRTIGLMLDFRTLAILDQENMITTGHQSHYHVFQRNMTDEANLVAMAKRLRAVGNIV